MENYANSLGLAFQIQDDILDIEGIESKVGKKTQKDKDAGKVTFISLLGLNEAKAKTKTESKATVDNPEADAEE